MVRLAALLAAALTVLGCGEPPTSLVLESDGSPTEVATVLQARLAESGFGGTATPGDDGRITVTTKGRDSLRLRDLLSRPGTLALKVGEETFLEGDIDADSFQVRPVPSRSGHAVTFRMALEREGAFKDATASIVTRTMSIFIDGRLECRPKVTAPIEGRVAIVSGRPEGWTEEEARDLVTALRSPLPAPVTIVTPPGAD